MALVSAPTSIEPSETCLNLFGGILKKAHLTTSNAQPSPGPTSPGPESQSADLVLAPTLPQTMHLNNKHQWSGG